MAFGRGQVPADHDHGRLYHKLPIKKGDVCRWCRAPLAFGKAIRCPNCDLPITGDNTILKAD